MRGKLAIAVATLATLAFAGNANARTTTVVPDFKVSVHAKRYAKHGVDGQHVKTIKIYGSGAKYARPKIKCSKKYCGNNRLFKGKTTRSKLYRKSVKFTRVNWVVSKGHGFRVNMVPRMKGRYRKAYGVYAQMYPPDSLNKRFTIGKVGCIKRSLKVVKCPAGARLPEVTRKLPVAPTAPPEVHTYTPGGPLAAVSPGGDRVMLLTVSNGELWWRSYAGGIWSQWQFVGGSVVSGFSAVSPAAGRVDAFARNSDGTIAHVTFSDASGWSGWSTIAGNATDTPVATSWGSGRIDLFSRGVTNNLTHLSSDDMGTTWSDQESLGECLTSAPGGASWGANRIDVFFRGCKSNELEHKWFNDTGWHLENLGTSIGGSPSVISAGSQHLDVFFQDLSTKIQHRWFNAGWTDLIALGGPATRSAPTVVVFSGSSGTQIMAFARGADNSVIADHWDAAGGWAAWQVLWP